MRRNTLEYRQLPRWFPTTKALSAGPYISYSLQQRASEQRTIAIQQVPSPHRQCMLLFHARPRARTPRIFFYLRPATSPAPSPDRPFQSMLLRGLASLIKSSPLAPARVNSRWRVQSHRSPHRQLNTKRVNSLRRICKEMSRYSKNSGR